MTAQKKIDKSKLNVDININALFKKYCFPTSILWKIPSLP